MTDRVFKQLKGQRGQIKAELTRFENFVNSFTDSQSITTLESRLDEVVQHTLKTFKDIQSKIEEIFIDEGKDPEIEGEYDIREQFETRYFHIISVAREIINQNQPSISVSPVLQNTLSSTPCNANVNVKLPSLKLIEFSGKFSDWKKFHDTFNALVHNNNNISNVEKFYHLQASLKGEAAEVIDALPLTETNYDIAYKLLNERYEDNREIIKSHIREIMDIPHITRESHTGLRILIDTFLKNYRSLQLLDAEAQYWNNILLYILTDKLDNITRRNWEDHIKDMNIVNINELITFLSKRCKILNTMQPKTQINANKKIDVKCNLSTNKLDSCILCKGEHRIFWCDKFKEMSVDARFELTKKFKLCTNCLRPGHKSSDCRSSNCKICNQKHSSFLHRNKVKNDNPIMNKTLLSENSKTDQDIAMANNTVLSMQTKLPIKSFVILSTAKITALNKNRQPVECRVILDSGSQANFVTKEFVTLLNLSTSSINIPIQGINNERINISKRVEINIASINTNFKTKLSFLVIDRITNNTPQLSFSSDALKIPANIALADPGFNESKPIDMLIGAETFYDLLCVGQIKLGNSQPTITKTLFGWIISGNISLNKITPQATTLFSTLSLNEQVERFWKVEECINDESKYTIQETECEDEFVKNTYRDKDGRFVVKLPLKSNHLHLGDSNNIASKRLQSIERKFQSNPQFCELYANFIKEYEDLGHMSQVSSKCDHSDKIYYIPHHGVEKPSSTTTKLRVVFDGSALPSSGLSLNQILKVGPIVQQDLFSILLRFRKHNFVLIGDLEKMYRQILIQPEQRDLQRIMWRESSKDEIKYYRLNTVTYGLASSSFLATRCIKQIGLEVQNKYPLESKIILSDFYVDDLITGAENVEMLSNLKLTITKLLSEYGFNLTKLKSNEPLIGVGDNFENKSTKYSISDGQITRTLGVDWNSQLDQFEYCIDASQLNDVVVSKRIILSFIAKIFDPLGLLGPIIIQLKLLMQRIWQLNINWDESLPQEIHSRWLNIRNELIDGTAIKIPRYVLLEHSNYEIHGFCDASEKAYACSIYVRSFNNNEIKCRLLCTKTRVAPLKALSLPRLELSGALLLAELLTKCLEFFDIKFDYVYLYSDSTIVLSWLSSESRDFHVFVANRIAKIQNLTAKFNWFHVRSQDNPADILTRGSNVSNLIKNSLYWYGPSFLQIEFDKQEYTARTQALLKNKPIIPEYKRTTVRTLLAQEENIFPIFTKYSKLQKLLRITAYCFRFVNNARSANNHCISSLSIDEIQGAKNALLLLCQKQGFEDEINHLSKYGEIKRNSKIKSLSPFLDNLGILRVGGRLKLSDLSYNHKHQILLPKNHSFTKLVIQYEHERSLHAGIQGTLSHIRQNYWPINATSNIKQIIRNCKVCFRVNPPMIHQKMGDLPSVRTSVARPFVSVGIDYAGPFDLKDGKLRNKKIVKSYVCLFVCMITKALHLELITDLTAQGFISMLKRFSSRRGLPRDVYSDNGTNFVGGNNLLISVTNLIDKSAEINSFFNENEIRWHFIPAHSPHFGGLWEAGVKSMKYHLNRSINHQLLTYEEFYTLITQIEGVLNSRPLVPLSNDPSDLEVLTPGHFLIGRALTAVPQQDLSQVKMNYTKRYQFMEKTFQDIWRRWSIDYLHQLQQKTKWFTNNTFNPVTGELVVLREDNLPPSLWIMGRIIDVHPGADGRVRVVSVKTRNGIIKRNITKISLLPNNI